MCWGSEEILSRYRLFYGRLSFAGSLLFVHVCAGINKVAKTMMHISDGTGRNLRKWNLGKIGEKKRNG